MSQPCQRVRRRIQVCRMSTKAIELKNCICSGTVRIMVYAQQHLDSYSVPVVSL